MAMSAARQLNKLMNSFILSPETLRKCVDYKQKIIAGELKPGLRLEAELSRYVPMDQPTADKLAILKTLNLEEFLVALINTKVTTKEELNELLQDQRQNKTLHWTTEERSLLGDLGVRYASPRPGQAGSWTSLLVAQGADLQDELGGDYAELVQEGELDEEAYYQLCKRRFLPLLIQGCQNKKLFYVLQFDELSDFCGLEFVRPELQEKVRPLFQKALKRLLEEEGAQIPLVKGIVLRGSGFKSEKASVGKKFFRALAESERLGEQEEKEIYGDLTAGLGIHPLSQLLWATVLDWDKDPRAYEAEEIIYVHSPAKKELINIERNEGLQYLPPPAPPKPAKQAKLLGAGKATQEEKPKEKDPQEQDKNDFQLFVKLYHQHRKQSFFKNPWAAMLTLLAKGKVSNMAEVRAQIAKNKNTRSAKVLEIFEAVKTFQGQGQVGAFKQDYERVYKKDGFFRNPWSKMHLLFAESDRKKQKVTKEAVVEHVISNPLSRSARVLVKK